MAATAAAKRRNLFVKRMLCGLAACLLLLSGCVATPEPAESGAPYAAWQTTSAAEAPSDPDSEAVSSAVSSAQSAASSGETGAPSEAHSSAVSTVPAQSTTRSTAQRGTGTKATHSAPVKPAKVELINGVPSAPVSAVNVKPYTFKYTLSDGSRKLIIDAQVYEPPTKQLHLFKAEPRLINEAEEKQFIAAVTDSNIKLTPNSNDPRRLRGKDALGELSFVFRFNNFWTFNRKGTAGSYPLKKPSDAHHAPGCKNISAEDALDKARGIVSSFPRLTDMAPSLCAIYDQEQYNGKYITPTGSYGIFFTQYADNLPIPIDYLTGSPIQSRFFFNDNGIYTTYMEAYDLTPTKTYTSWLSLEEAVERLKAHLGSLYFSQYTPVFEISLEYRRDDTKTVTPVWRFCVDQLQVFQKGLDQDKYGATDMVVNAVTGEVSSIYTRYHDSQNKHA